MPSLYCAINGLLKEHLGLKISSIGQNTVDRAILHRMRELGIDSRDAYLERISGNAAEINALIEEVVIPETWFFRDPGYFQVLGELAVGGKLPGEGPVRVLSVPCATGEEAYTLSIVLQQTGISPGRLRVDGIDISGRAIDRARAGIYRNRSFRGADLQYRDVYFTRDGDHWRILDSIRRTVTFHCGNILSDSFMRGLGRYDVVFCKNLLIYLDTRSRKKAMLQLRELLTPKGFLFAGPAETILFHDVGFALGDAEHPYLFVRAELPGPAPIRETGQSAPSGAGAVAGTGALPPSRDKQPLLTAMNRNTAIPAASAVPRTTAARVLPLPGGEQVLETAKRLADSGHLEQARKLLADALRKGEATAGHYHLLGVIAEAGQQPQEAIAFFRKAVYLDPLHEESLSLLALLAQRTGDGQMAGYYRDRLQRLRERKTA
ncbi:MAG: CheR family methyltransferase [Thermodesulfobacteriota bacterium]